MSSILATSLSLSGEESTRRAYYLCAGETVDEVEHLQRRFCGAGIDAHIRHADQCQRGWAESNTADMSVFSDDLTDFYRRSLLLIKTQFDDDGAIIAANDSDNLRYNRDTYSYMWPRDGALVASALIQAGYTHITRSFFTFCRDVLYDEGCLLHKYNPNKTLGSSWHPWVRDNEYSLPIQEDETALVLHALLELYEATKDTAFINDLADDLIKPMADFLIDWRYDNGLPKDSYDLWEERRGTYTFTTASVIAGLRAAKQLAGITGDEDLSDRCDDALNGMRDTMITYLYNEDDEYFRRGVHYDEDGITEYDETLDASAYATFALGVFDADDPRVEKTMEKVGSWLQVNTDVGGIARYYNDPYKQVADDIDRVPGNPWFICTLWHAQWRIAHADNLSELRQAKDHINWVHDHALSTGVLPEQVNPFTGEGVSVSPLTWSHAELVKTMTQYAEKHEVLT